MWCLQENQRFHILAHWSAAPIANTHNKVHLLEYGFCHWLFYLTNLQCCFSASGSFDKIQQFNPMLHWGRSLDSWISCFTMFFSECNMIFWNLNICFSWYRPKIYQWILAIPMETTWITCYSKLCSLSSSWWLNWIHELHHWSNLSYTFSG